MTRFERVVQILSDAVGPGSIGAHGRFWEGVSRDEFVDLRVFGRRVLVVGDGESSLLVQALRGEGLFGADLDPPTPGASFRRMPAGLDAVPDEQIDYVSGWIDEGCPDGPEPETSDAVARGE